METQNITTEAQQMVDSIIDNEIDMAGTSEIETTEQRIEDTQKTIRESTETLKDIERKLVDNKNYTANNHRYMELDISDDLEYGEGFMYIPATLNGKKKIATIDTGSAISIISPKIYKTIRNSNNHIMAVEGPMVKLSLADGSALEATGNVECEIQIGDSKIITTSC